MTYNKEEPLAEDKFTPPKKFDGADFAIPKLETIPIAPLGTNGRQL